MQIQTSERPQAHDARAEKIVTLTKLYATTSGRERLALGETIAALIAGAHETDAYPVE